MRKEPEVPRRKESVLVSRPNLTPREIPRGREERKESRGQGSRGAPGGWKDAVATRGAAPLSFLALSPENTAKWFYTPRKAEERWGGCRLSTLGEERKPHNQNTQAAKQISNGTGDKHRASMAVERGKEETGLFRGGKAGGIRRGAELPFGGWREVMRNVIK